MVISPQGNHFVRILTAVFFLLEIPCRNSGSRAGRMSFLDKTQSEEAAEDDKAR